MNCVYNALLTKQKQAEIMAQQGKRQYEYDSDEDIEVTNQKAEIICSKMQLFFL